MFDDYNIKFELYRDSYEGKLIERLKSKGITEVDAVMQKVEDQETYREETQIDRIQRKLDYEIQENKNIDEIEKTKLDSVVDTFKRKYNI